MMPPRDSVSGSKRRFWTTWNGPVTVPLTQGRSHRLSGTLVDPRGGRTHPAGTKLRAAAELAEDGEFLGKCFPLQSAEGLGADRFPRQPPLPDLLRAGGGGLDVELGLHSGLPHQILHHELCEDLLRAVTEERL